jgi:predicted RNase H-like HicB family nuclease
MAAFAAAGCVMGTMLEFIALICRDAGGPYRVTFADFPNLMATGDTLNDARTNAEWALHAHMRNLMAAGAAIPEPLSLEAVTADPWHKDALEITTMAWIQLDNGDDDNDDAA